ncbi:MAG: TatD family hydrolase [Burkholderiaceae bacterium]
MWIDTHCHLDAREFGIDSGGIAERARQQNVLWIVIPAVEPGNFDAVRTLARSQPNCAYALGIHPVCVPQAEPDDLHRLRAAIPAALEDPRFVAIGEIGLDFFLPALCTNAMREKQTQFYVEQLKIARYFDLPVLLHVRRSQDQILKYLRRIVLQKGIAHAFNGSVQQANAFIDLGFSLGFGGAMTFSRAFQIRRLASALPLNALVLETDAPDIAPAWVHSGRNSPEQLPRIGRVLAELRGLTPEQVSSATCDNAYAALPRLARLR